MHDFVAKLSAEQKQELKDVLNTKGINIVALFLEQHIYHTPMKAINENLPLEEVPLLRGEFRAYRNVMSFLTEAKKSLIEFDPDEAAQDSLVPFPRKE